MVEKEGEEIKATTDDVTPKVEDAPTTEQQMETLQAKLEVETKAREKAESSVQGLRGSLTEKDTQISRLSDEQTWQKGMEERMELIATAVATGQGNLEGIDTDTQKTVLTELKGVQTRQKAERQQVQLKTQEGQYKTQAGDSLQKVTELGYKKGSDEYEEVYDILEGGWNNLSPRAIEKAERRIAKMSKSEDTKKVETDDEVYERIKLQKEKDDGLHKVDTAQVGGMTASDAEFKKRIGDGSLALTKENLKRVKELQSA